MVMRVSVCGVCVLVCVCGVCVLVCVCACCCVCGVCVRVGVCGVARRKNPPCVNSKRPRVYRRPHVFTHAGVVSVHTGTF